MKTEQLGMRRTVTFGENTLIVEHIRGWRVLGPEGDQITSVWVRDLEYAFTAVGDFRETLLNAVESAA
jgi:hypothetical protein